VAAEVPNETLRKALRRLGEYGVRAEEFLDSAAEHLGSDHARAAQHAAYAIREALMSIVKLGGARPRGIKEAAEDVVRRWKAKGLDERLAESIRQLGEVLDGPGPNERLLEQAVAGLARVRPTRTTADLLDQFVAALREANEGTHSDTVPDLAAMAALYERTCVLLGDLFGPISVRFTAMDDLVGIREPGPDDVARLKQRLGDERHLIYLFDRADGPGWFNALRDDPLLLPPPAGPWTAGPYVARVAEAHPDEARRWLSRLPGDLNAKQVADVLRIARIVQAEVADLVLRVARDHLDSPDVRFQVEVFTRAMAPDERDTRTGRSLIQWSLTHALGGERAVRDMYMAAELLTIAVEATPGSDPDAWLTMLAYRARQVAEGVPPLRVQLTYPLSTQSLHAARRPLELIATAVLQAASASALANVPIADRLDRLRLIPEPLASRLLAQHLLDHLPETNEQARDFIAEQIAVSERPSVEELALLRRLFEDGVSGIEEAAAAALGAPPSAAALGDPPSDAAIRGHRWLVAVPDSVAPEWHEVDAAITERVGAASQDGVMMRIGPARFGGAPSPIPLDELTAVSPLDAAARVAAWRPPAERSFLDPGAEGLAGTLRDAIAADPDSWLAADLVELARTLQHPTYITVLLQALTEREDGRGIAPEEVVAVTELVRSEPWPVEDLGEDPDAPDASWRRPSDQAITLLGRLGGLDLLRDDAVAERAWAQVVDAFNRRDDTSPYVDDQERDPLSVAINRPSMRALEAAFAVGHTSEQAPNEQLLSLLDEVLDINGVNGLHSRAILALRLPYLRSTAPEWFAEREDRIFGESAPDRLGAATFDLYLQWVTPSGPLVEDQRERLISALTGERHEEATHHLLHGLLWRLPDFEAPAIAEILIGAGNAALSYAGQWLGWALSDVEDLDLAPVIELWRELLDRRLEAEAYRGFGWMALNAHLDDKAWLTLTEETAIATDGALDEPERVAERAARTPSDTRAAVIVTRLLRDDPDPWDLERIGARGLEILRNATDSDVAAELREQLLERGFHDARDI
jgi:hypothetical protein